MNASSEESDTKMEVFGAFDLGFLHPNLWILSWVMAIMVYFLGAYINWKIISVSWKTKDKTWKEDIVHSTIMMIVMPWTIVFENVSLHVKVLSRYTGGDWICYLTAFFYSYNTFIGGFHSFTICFMKYIYIVHHEKVREYGEEKLQKIFFFTYFIHPLLLTIPTVILLDFEVYSSVIGCYGLEEGLMDRYAYDGLSRMFLCKLVVDVRDSEFLYYLAQGFCSLKMAWVIMLASNIPEGFLYYKIFQFMRR